MSIQHELDAAGDLTYAAIQVDRSLLLGRPDLHAVLLGYSFSEHRGLSKEEAAEMLRAMCLQVHALGGIDLRITKDDATMTVEIAEAPCLLH